MQLLTTLPSEFICMFIITRVQLCNCYFHTAIFCVIDTFVILCIMTLTRNKKVIFENRKCSEIAEILVECALYILSVAD